LVRKARHTARVMRKKALGRIGRIKAPIILAAVKLKGSSMHKNSGIVLYWLVLLALVVLNLMAAIVVPVLQVSVGSQKLLLIVAALGFFFGYVANKLLSLIENLEARHHVFARLLVPATAMLNIFLVSHAANRVVAFLGIGFKHDPLIVSIAYGAAFMVPSLFSAAAAAASNISSRSRVGK